MSESSDSSALYTLKNMLDKQQIGWISRDELAKTIITTKSPAMKPMKALTGKMNIIDLRGNLVYQEVPLRPIFVVKMRSYFYDILNGYKVKPEVRVY